MIGTIYITGVIGEDTNLVDVIRQVKAQNATEFLVKIDSVGGYVDAGFDIYNYLKNLDKPVSTYALKAYSIASVIFMAGSTRIVSENAIEPLMIHLPWMEVAGSHNEITAHLSELKAVEDKLVKFYSEALEIDKNTIQSLLTNETFLTATKALELGLATTIQPAQRAVAMINNKNKEDESLMNKFLKKASQILNKISGIKAELTLQDATGVELVFPDLEPTDVVAPDEKVTVDGKPAEGEYLMPDGSTLIVEGGLVVELKPSETPTEEDNALDAEGDAPSEDVPADDKDVKIAELEAEITELKAKIAELEGTKADDETEAENKVLEVLNMASTKVTDLEAKYNALAKMVGSDYQPDTKKENTPTVKASAEQKSRAWQILNS